MAFASNVDLVRVKGEYVDFQGAAIAGQVTFRVPSTIQNANGDQILVPSTYAADLDANGQFGISLPITNDSDFNSTFQYTVLESFSGGQSFSLSLPARRNLVSNPCFRVGTDGWSVLGAGTTFSRITTDSFVTGSCLEITKGTGSPGAFIDVAVTAGLVYTLSFYAKVPTGQEGAPLRAWIDWRNAGYLSTTASTTVTITSSSGWTRLSVTGTAPVGATTARCYALVNSGTAGQKFLVDAVQVEQAATVGSYMVNGGTPRTNLIPNPSFETNTTGWAASGSAAGSASVSTAQALFGSSGVARSCTGSGVAYVETDYIAVSASSTYMASAWVRSTVARGCQVIVNFYNGVTAIAQVASSSVTSSASGWTRISVTGTAPTSTTSVKVFLTANSVANGETHFWDGVMLEASAFLGDYIDGSLPNTEWSGTAHASTSRTFYPMAEIRPASTGVEYVGMAPYGSSLAADTRVTAQEALLPTLPSLATVTDYATARLNLVTNPSVETNATSWNANLSSSGVRSTAFAFSGSASLAATYNTTVLGGAGIYWWQNAGSGPGYPVTAGLSYTFSVYVRDTAASRNYLAGLEWRNSDTVAGTQLSQTSGTLTTVALNGWTRVTVTGTAPAGAKSVVPICYVQVATTAGQVVYFDAAMLEQSSTVGSYFDGSTSGFWTGTANASTSRNYSAPSYQIVAEASRDAGLAIDNAFLDPFLFTGAG